MTASADRPVVATVVIPMRNEEARLRTCLDSVIANEVVGGDVEILVIDGASSDTSPAIAREYAVRTPRLRVLDNPARLQSHAFNIGIAEARGRYVVRMDAHSVYAPDYIAECLRILEETGADNVGGVQRAVGTTPLTRAIAAAVSSPFAAGDAKYRHATVASFVDTVYLGAWRTDTVRALAGMRTDLAVNEDYEMNVRLRKRGGRIYLSPTIRSTYFVRGSLRQLARQYGRYGYWKVRTLLDHPDSTRWRQLVAPAFVASIVATPLMLQLMGPLGAAHLVAYVVANVVASVLTARRTGWANLPLLPIAFATIHLSWGTGFWLGVVGWGIRRVVSRG